jgi:hypothetical protein
MKKLIKISLLGLGLLVAIAGISAAAGSHHTKPTKPPVDTVNRDEALSNVIDQIDGGPAWETAEMAAAVHANVTGQSGANDGCAWLYNAHAHKIPGFACYLEYDDPTAPDADPQTGMVDVYFHADRNGERIHPISSATYGLETIGTAS